MNGSRPAGSFLSATHRERAEVRSSEGKIRPVCVASIFSGKGHPAWNMAVDEALLRVSQGARSGQMTVRFYGWDRPSVSIGYFQRHALVREILQAQQASHLSLIRRPTAGGMVTHVSDWTYSLVYPVSMGLGYATIHGFIQRALQKVLGWDDMESLPPAQAHHGKISQCFAQPSAHDLMRQGKKIAGGAERRSKGWILHQGSVSLPDVLDEKLCAGLAIEFVKLLEEDLENPVLGRELSLQEASLAKELCESRYATRAWNEKY